MKKRVGQRGLSPVIASVLLIALVLVLAAIIFLWARGFISEQIEKFGTPIEELCESVNFDIEVIGNTFEIANRGNVDIHKFDVKVIDVRGESDVNQFAISVRRGESVQDEVRFLDDKPLTDIEKIIVYPVLAGNVKGKTINKVFTCTEQGRTFKRIGTEWH
tara:strand:+ start:719 stop:1201 length:483 start_codon:yes stop_codon:yes gene_type:complete